MTDETDPVGPPKPLPPRYPGDTLHETVMALIAKGHAHSFTSALGVGFYGCTSPEHKAARDAMLRAFNVPMSRFSGGFIRDGSDRD